MSFFVGWRLGRAPGIPGCVSMISVMVFWLHMWDDALLAISLSVSQCRWFRTTKMRENEFPDEFTDCAMSHAMVRSQSVWERSYRYKQELLFSLLLNDFPAYLSHSELIAELKADSFLKLLFGLVCPKNLITFSNTHC